MIDNPRPSRAIWKERVTIRCSSCLNFIVENLRSRNLSTDIDTLEDDRRGRRKEEEEGRAEHREKESLINHLS